MHSSEEMLPINQSNKFKPNYTIQVFRESEEILGYENLKINIYFSADDLVPLVQYSYTKKENKADDIIGNLSKIFEAGFYTEKQEFLDHLKSHSFKPLWEKIKSYSDKEKNLYEVNFLLFFLKIF